MERNSLGSENSWLGFVMEHNQQIHLNYGEKKQFVMPQNTVNKHGFLKDLITLLVGNVFGGIFVILTG